MPIAIKSWDRGNPWDRWAWLLDFSGIDNCEKMDPKEYNELKELIDRLSIQRGEFTLASGAKANYYIDCRKVTLDSRGAALLGKAILEKLNEKTLPDAVGGMAIGADPITGAVITTAGLEGIALNGFIVRKEEKKHGTGRAVEGPIQSGQTAIMLEDVVTTGGSSLTAIERAKEAGLEVQGLICIVDRLAGGREKFESIGVEFQSLFTIEDFGLTQN